jgi:8-oxo-dGTP diphosphatase
MTYRNPVPTVDVIVHRPDDKRQVLLIERNNPPHGWALPGGFLDEGEFAFDGAVREVNEETGLDVSSRVYRLFHAYTDPARDPRQHTLSLVFLADSDGTPHGADDAASARFYSLDALPQLAFDHATILADYDAFLRGVVPPARR